jgi:hypothetical protein
VDQAEGVGGSQPELIHGFLRRGAHCREPYGKSRRLGQEARRTAANPSQRFLQEPLATTGLLQNYDIGPAPAVS